LDSLHKEVTFPYSPPETFQANRTPPHPVICLLMKKQTRQSIGIAPCSFELVSGATEIQLTPSGRFRAKDGRPHEVAQGWYIDNSVAQDVLNAIRGRNDRYVIDYDHQTLYTRENGQPAPAAGWYRGEDVVWREGVGLVATKVEWTPKAAAAIEAKEYRYISPVIVYNRKTGHIADILMAAVVNYAAIDGMAEIERLAAAHFEISKQEDKTVNELLIAILSALAILPATATETDLDKVKQVDVLKAIQDMQASQASLSALRKSLALSDDGDVAQAIAVLKANQGGKPDPAQYVPIDTVKALQTQLAALSAKVTGGEVDALVNGAIEDGKLLEAQRAWAVELGSKDLAALKGYLDTAPSIAALKAGQTGGAAGGKNAHGLTEQQMAVCKGTGVKPEDYAATLKTMAESA